VRIQRGQHPREFTTLAVETRHAGPGSQPEHSKQVPNLLDAQPDLLSGGAPFHEYADGPAVRQILRGRFSSHGISQKISIPSIRSPSIRLSTTSRPPDTRAKMV